MANGGNGIYKWVAGVLVAFLLGITPFVISSVRGPSSDDIDKLRERQELMLRHIATLDAEVEDLQGDVNDVQMTAEQIREYLRTQQAKP